MYVRRRRHRLSGLGYMREYLGTRTSEKKKRRIGTLYMSHYTRNHQEKNGKKFIRKIRVVFSFPSYIHVYVYTYFVR